MPGGRLTEQDRHLIASGLADGLGYAEIARGLGRPTSTVSREVARNGGPDRYRAEHAHLATSRRARRQGPALDEPAEVTDSAAVREVEEHLVEAMLAMGLPRLPSRVMAALCLSDDGCTASELVARLRVSPASVSKVIAYLEGMDLVRRERENSRGRERYFMDGEVWIKSWEANIRSNAMMADAAAEGAKVLDGTPAGERLIEMSELFAWLRDDMTRVAGQVGAMLERRRGGERPR
ncbi:MarR family protein [Herbihabitans rhizosphaerae]|uniref:MarR family protein n=1 Tax=Herbihabitans rhizosphaerae TaxID=1872711 RepID=A0A4Q7KKM1_9PSEU|nr:helix-turn-helix domain-containing protein [Herbihabitans rhizosphaerae]RZS37025.1 MarR family protein [Herbihabitans rhizosphaerae]